jgi:UDP-N-acetylmuramoyl-tripeptide--D-alanyl-D-alanine ligase
MIALSLDEIAAVTGGTAGGHGAVTVTAPAVLDGPRRCPRSSSRTSTRAGGRTVALADNAAAVDWLRTHLAPGQVVLVKASRAARLDEVAAALA